MGLLDSLNSQTGPIATGMSSPLFALGAGLIGGAQPFANPGQQLMSAAANQQQLAMGNMQMRMLQQQMPMLMPILKQLGGLMGSPQSVPTQSPQQGAPQIGPAPPPLIAATPQQLAAQGVSQTPQAPQGLLSGPSPAPAGSSGGMDPVNLARFGLLASVLPMTQPMGKAAMQAAQIALQTNPDLATQMAAAKSTLAQDQSLYAQAQSQGDKLGMQAARMKYLKDAGMVNVAAYNGAVTTMGGLTPAEVGANTLNPVQGIQTTNGVESPIPGAAATQAALAAAKTGAQKRAELGAATAPAGATPGQSRSVPIAQSGPMGAAAAQQPNYIPPILLSQSRLPQAPGNTGAQQLLTFQDQQARKASTTADEYEEQATNAQTLLTQADQINAAARDFTPGRYAEVKGEIMAALQPTGILSPDQTRSLGSYQEGQKLSIQLQAMVTKQLGSREAAQVFSVMGKSIPNLTLSQDGLGKISAYLKGIAQYQLAQNTFAQRLSAQGNVAGVNSLSSNFQTYSNPVYYILASAPTNVAQEFIGNMAPAQRAKIQDGWKKAISAGLAPAPGDYN